MGERRQYRQSELFLVRLWLSPSQDGGETAECHGRVQRAVDGQADFFDDWASLIESLTAMTRDKHATTERLSGGQNNEQG